MRGPAALATALLLTVALLVSGCGLVDSLTPFGIDTKSYSAEGVNPNGIWVGTTGNGGAVTFQVGNDAVSRLLLVNATEGCNQTFEDEALVEPIVGGSFTVELAGDQGGRFVVTGRFTSSTSCSGTYFFEALPAGVCPTSGSGTFTAERISL
jgi:hypothetical protein